jgi:type II secretory pathway predicted ATPase ExeA
MSNPVEEIELGEEFSKSVIESFKKGSRTGLSAENVFESFGFSSNPFEVTNLISHPDLITEKTKGVIMNLAERIGACYKNEGHLIVISPEGSARTTVLKLLNATFNKDIDKNFSSYVDAPKTWSGLSSKDNNEDERVDNFQKWMEEVNFTNTRIIVVDDADAFVSSARQYADAIKFEHLQIPTMVYCITPTTQHIISKSDLLKDFFADAFWITPLENQDIKELILKSINKFSADSSHPFDESAIDKIVEYSLGLPGGATRLASLCLRNAYQIGTKKIDKDLVKRVATNDGYDTGLQLLHQEIKLEGTKYKVTIEILTQLYVRGGGVERTMVISSFSDMATSTLSYHLKDLINDGIIKQERIGYKIYYFIPKAIRSALQLLLLSPVNVGDDNSN